MVPQRVNSKLMLFFRHMTFGKFQHFFTKVNADGILVEVYSSKSKSV